MHAQIGDLVFATDLIPGTPWVHVPISMGYDRFPEQLIDEKSRFLNAVVEEKRRLFYTHDPDYAVSSITFENGRYQATDLIKTLQEER